MLKFNEFYAPMKHTKSKSAALMTVARNKYVMPKHFAHFV